MMNTEKGSPQNLLAAPRSPKRHSDECFLDHLGDKVIPNAEVWMDESFFKDGSCFLLHHRLRFWTGGAFLLYSRLPPGSTTWWQEPESSWSPVGGTGWGRGVLKGNKIKCDSDFQLVLKHGFLYYTVLSQLSWWKSQQQRRYKLKKCNYFTQ